MSSAGGAGGAVGGGRRWRRRGWGAVAGLLALGMGLEYYADGVGRTIAPLQYVVVTGGDDRLRAEVEALLEEARGANLFVFDVAAWRRRIEDLPGAEAVQVRRKLPDTVEVAVESGAPVARFNGGLVDAAGRVYRGSADAVLPVLRGEAGRTAQMARFLTRARETAPAAIVQVEVDARGGWTVVMGDGVLLYLGRRPEARFARYARHAAALRAAMPDIRSVDLRYARGMAVVARPASDGN